jgi:hypothetical protein
METGAGMPLHLAENRDSAQVAAYVPLPGQSEVERSIRCLTVEPTEGETAPTLHLILDRLSATEASVTWTALDEGPISPQTVGCD